MLRGRGTLDFVFSHRVVFREKLKSVAERTFNFFKIEKSFGSSCPQTDVREQQEAAFVIVLCCHHGLKYSTGIESPSREATREIRPLG